MLHAFAFLPADASGIVVDETGMAYLNGSPITQHPKWNPTAGLLVEAKLSTIIKAAEFDAVNPLDALTEVLDTIDEGEHTHSGVIIKAIDSGRVLLTQRTPYAEDPDDVYGRWEFPGGGIGEGEDAFTSALREFREETGLELPEDWAVAGHYENGPYIAMVVVVPHEAWTTNARMLSHETMGIGWFHPDQIDGSELGRVELEKTDWPMVREASSEGWEEREPGCWLLMRPDGFRAVYERSSLDPEKLSRFTEMFGTASYGWQRYVNVWVPGAKDSGGILSGTAGSLVAAQEKSLRAGASNDEAVVRYQDRQRSLFSRDASLSFLRDASLASFPDRIPGRDLYGPGYDKRDALDQRDWEQNAGPNKLVESKKSGLWEDVRLHGVQEPIYVFVPPAPQNPQVSTGHHRIAVANDLGVDVPVRWYGPGYEDVTGQPRSYRLSLLHDEPEPALPSVEGEFDDDPLSPAAIAQREAALGGGGSDTAEIARAAEQYLAKTALRTFTPKEQMELIEEGQGVTASNLDLLDLTGTHYELLDERFRASEASLDDLFL